MNNIHILKYGGFSMNETYIEEKETYTIENKNYNVTTRVAQQRLSKESLIKLIAKYGMQELQTEDL